MLPAHWSQGWGWICSSFLLSGLFPEPSLQFRHTNSGPHFSLPRCFCSLAAISRLPLCTAQQSRQTVEGVSPHCPRGCTAANAIVLSWILVSSLLSIHGFVSAVHWENHPSFTSRLVLVSATRATLQRSPCHGAISTERQFHAGLGQLCLGFSETFHWISTSFLRQVVLNVSQYPCGGYFSICLASDQDRKHCWKYTLPKDCLGQLFLLVLKLWIILASRCDLSSLHYYVTKKEAEMEIGRWLQ